VADRMLTQHPTGKAGVNIARFKYDAVRSAMLDAIGDHGELAFKELAGEVRRRLAPEFEGSVSWYVTTVKLDLEARGEIERIPNQRPQKLRLAN
jgi:hypothetical protein